MAGDPFTSAIFRWLNAVAADPTLPPAAFKLAYGISQHINRQTHTAWPSQETLAEVVGLKSARSVRRLTDALEERGFLLTTRRKQASQIYRLAQDRTELSYLDEGAEVLANETRPDENDRSQDQDRTFPSSRPDISVPKTGQECPPNHLKNHLLNHEGETRARATLLPDDFKVSAQTYNWALARLGTNDAVERSIERFRNHYLQVDGKAAKSRNWDAKLRNWIDDDARKAPQKKSAVGAPAEPMPDDNAWNALLQTYAKTGRWTRNVDQIGPDPSMPGCRAPRHLLVKFGIIREDAA